MKRSILYFVLATMVLNGLSGCSEPVVEKIEREITVLREVDTFDLQRDRKGVSFGKSGFVSSKIVAFVSPQVVGSVEQLRVKVGQSVREGEVLAVLGNSLATDIADLQADAAAESLGLSSEINQQTADLQNNQLVAAQIAVKTAWENYQAALRAKEESADLFELQVDSADLNVDRAEDAYDDAQDAYDELNDQLDDLEEQLDEMDEMQAEQRAQLETQIEALELQLDQIDQGIDAADDGITQAENAVELIEEGHDSQVNQLELGVEMAFQQYQSALNGLSSAQKGGNVQILSGNLQLLQAQSGYESAKLNAESQNVLSPISGVVSEVMATESNLVAPGQVMFKIENPDSVSVKMALSLDEVKFLKVGDLVEIKDDKRVSRGKVASISPVINELTHKIDLEIEVIDQKVFISGEMVKVNFEVNPRSAIFVPLVSLDVKGNVQFVKVLNRENIVEFKVVKMGQVFGDYVEIFEGLRGNEVIVSSPSSFVEEGEEVKMKPVKIER